jgi:hypothetical protein
VAFFVCVAFWAWACFGYLVVCCMAQKRRRSCVGTIHEWDDGLGKDARDTRHEARKGKCIWDMRAPGLTCSTIGIDFMILAAS